MEEEEGEGEGEEQGSLPVEGVEETQGGPYRRRLRHRSMGEGGYVRLHMGLEEEEESKTPAPQRASTPKVHTLTHTHTHTQKHCHIHLLSFLLKTVIQAANIQTFLCVCVSRWVRGW